MPRDDSKRPLPVSTSNRQGSSRGRASSKAKPASRKAGHDRARRAAVFAMYSEHGRLDGYVRDYLLSLSEVCATVLCVADNNLRPTDRAWLKSHSIGTITGRHGEYDFGSYKRGLHQLRAAGSLDDLEQIILCNDSCYGPIGGFADTMAKMAARDLDFWGITANTQIQPHVQSYFVAFNNRVVADPAFWAFFDSVKVEPSVQEVVCNYEVPMTAVLEASGFRWGSLIDKTTPGFSVASREGPNLTLRPVYMVEAGSPLVKVKAFRKTRSNLDGLAATLMAVQNKSPKVARRINEHSKASLLIKAAERVSFSIVMPFLNRRASILYAVNSILAQTHQNYELILVDDGSTDGTSELLRALYLEEIHSGRIRILNNKGLHGVSEARNMGLKHSLNDWVAYVDSDNAIKPRFLETFAAAIVDTPDAQAFFCRYRLRSNGRACSQHFDRDKLQRGNYIDLGAFVHSRELYKKLGGFDTDLKRLVDWDLILRYTADVDPAYLQHILMLYTDDDEDVGRISVSQRLDDARLAIRKKHGHRPRVTTIIPTYNHEKYIAEAIQSALNQEGITHEIIVCDDGSTDLTPKIVAGFARENPGVIRNLSLRNNQGISDTFRRCISAASINSDTIAILEGDDFWIDNKKLKKQAAFLFDNPDCSMVFSQINLLNSSGKLRVLERQASITKDKLSGQDFLDDPSMNLIANFSSCMFKSGLLKSLPDRLFEGRLNEIALAFHLERYGKIGFIKQAMSVYRQHPAGVWTGSDAGQQLRSGLATREMTRDVADPKYRARIEQIIHEKYVGPLSAMARAEPARPPAANPGISQLQRFRRVVRKRYRMLTKR